jgi:hypothetical protein
VLETNGFLNALRMSKKGLGQWLWWGQQQQQLLSVLRKGNELTKGTNQVKQHLS